MDATRTTTTGAPTPVGRGAVAAGGRTVVEPRKIKDVPPRYPDSALRARISGLVILEATIDKRGKVADLRVIRSVPELDRAAMDAVSQWEYTPTLVDGVPADVMMTVTVTFSFGSGPPPQMGKPVPGTSAWPTQPAGAVRPGMGRGFMSPVIVIKQNADGMTLTRKFTDASEDIKYRFDGKESKNRLPGTGGAIDNVYTYVSRWDAGKIVSTITWNGPQGKRERTETISLDGDTLTIQNSRAPLEPGGEPMVTTNVFTKVKG